MDGVASIAELCLVSGRASARLICDGGAVPAPGRYLLAHDPSSDAALAAELFASEYSADGFIAAPPVPTAWQPGMQLGIRGPLGVGFDLPAKARRIALVAFDGDAACLVPVARRALAQSQAVALVGQELSADLPLQVEIHPLHAVREVLAWADYLAADVVRESLDNFLQLMKESGGTAGGAGQVLVRTRMPCGGLAACGVCTVQTKRGAKLACEDGPVFDLAGL